MPAETKTDAAAKVYMDMKLLGLEEIQTRAPPDLGTSVMARLLNGGDDGDGKDGGKGKKKGGGGGGARAIPRHSKNAYRESMVETPHSLVDRDAERERKRLEERNLESNHDERALHAIGRAQIGKRTSIIIPGMDLQSEPESLTNLG